MLSFHSEVRAIRSIHRPYGIASFSMRGKSGSEWDLLHFLGSALEKSGLSSSLPTNAPAEGEMKGLAGERAWQPFCRHRWLSEVDARGREAGDRLGWIAAAIVSSAQSGKTVALAGTGGHRAGASNPLTPIAAGPPIAAGRPVPPAAVRAGSAPVRDFL